MAASALAHRYLYVRFDAFLALGETDRELGAVVARAATYGRCTYTAAHGLAALSNCDPGSALQRSRELLARPLQHDVLHGEAFSVLRYWDRERAEELRPQALASPYVGLRLAAEHFDDRVCRDPERTRRALADFQTSPRARLAVECARALAVDRDLASRVACVDRIQGGEPDLAACVAAAWTFGLNATLRRLGLKLLEHYAPDAAGPLARCVMHFCPLYR